MFQIKSRLLVIHEKVSFTESFSILGKSQSKDIKRLSTREWFYNIFKTLFKTNFPILLWITDKKSLKLFDKAFMKNANNIFKSS